MIFTLGFLLQIGTIFLFLLWQWYWIITEQVANREKPKTTVIGMLGLLRKLRRRVLTIVEIVLILQLLGLQLFPFAKNSIIVQIIGFVLVLLGIGVAVSGRRALGVNWAPAPEYQIKVKQELVTTGIYKYIRHPIYVGISLAITGGELVAQSYLFFISIMLFYESYRQSQLEENLLIKAFGEQYRTYMKRTKMFLPYLW